jgi:hypothetical protein
VTTNTLGQLAFALLVSLVLCLVLMIAHGASGGTRAVLVGETT